MPFALYHLSQLTFSVFTNDFNFFIVFVMCMYVLIFKKLSCCSVCFLQTSVCGLHYSVCASVSVCFLECKTKRVCECMHVCVCACVCVHACLCVCVCILIRCYVSDCCSFKWTDNTIIYIQIKWEVVLKCLQSKMLLSIMSLWLKTKVMSVSHSVTNWQTSLQKL